MAYLRDLSFCTYQPYDKCGPVAAVGWLESPFDFPQGPVDKRVLDRLQELYDDPWLPIGFMGAHTCSICLASTDIPASSADGGRGKPPRGTRNLLLPGVATIFVAPELILHYMKGHGYCPPEIFCAAVLACPPMGSQAYFLRLLRAGNGDTLRLIESSCADDPEPYAAEARRALRSHRSPLAWVARQLSKVGRGTSAA